MGNMVEIRLTVPSSRPAHQVRAGNNRAKRLVENQERLYPQTLGDVWPTSAEDGAAKKPHTTSRDVTKALSLAWLSWKNQVLSLALLGVDLLCVRVLTCHDFPQTVNTALRPFLENFTSGY